MHAVALGILVIVFASATDSMFHNSNDRNSSRFQNIGQ